MASIVQTVSLQEAAIEKQAEQICVESGFTLHEILSKVTRRIVRDGHTPAYLFEPNETTIEAMKEVRQGHLKKFSSFQELIDDLDEEDD